MQPDAAKPVYDSTAATYREQTKQKKGRPVAMRSGSMRWHWKWSNWKKESGADRGKR